MSEKIVVPDGMLRAVRFACVGKAHTTVDDYMEFILTAALQWLANNPIYLMDDQVQRILDSVIGPPSLGRYRMIFAELQRTLFLEEEKEVPREIEDLMWSVPLYLNDAEFYKAIPNINKTILKAFERGKFAGKKEK